MSEHPDSKERDENGLQWFDMPNSYIKQFEIAMDRKIPKFERVFRSNSLNLGAGNKMILGTRPLSRETGWTAPYLNNDSESISSIYAYHFFEHLDAETAKHMLRECQRVMEVDAVLNIVVPYYSSSLAHQDLDHKSWWNENTFRILLDNPYYDTGNKFKWKLKVNSCLIMGLIEKDLVLCVQLVKYEA